LLFPAWLAITEQVPVPLFMVYVALFDPPAVMPHTPAAVKSQRSARAPVAATLKLVL